MIVEDDKFVVYGEKPTVPVPEGLLGKYIYDTLSNINVDYSAMVDVFTSEHVSYNQLLEDTCNLAEALRQFGCNSNTIVSIFSENCLKYFTPVIASLYLGATVAPINHAYVEHELRHILNLYEPTIIFCSSATCRRILALRREFKSVKKIILLDNGGSMFDLETIDQFVGRNLRGNLVHPGNFRPFTDADPCENISFIMSSSGTTGLPKGVMQTDRNILVRISNAREPLIGIGPLVGNAALGLMPFFHGFGLNVTLASLLNKELVTVFQRFDEDIFLKTLQDYKISVVAVAPTLATFLAKSPKVDKYDLSSIKEIICGSAPMSKELENTLKKRLNISVVRQAYGLTESTLAITFLKREKVLKPGSSGEVVPHMCIKIRDPESGKSLGPNEVGELCVKGPLIMKGYYKNPQATKESFTSDGWLKTGDLAYYDDDKYFYVVDRLKELIKYKGYQVAPAELEAILLNHPKVLDVGVVGLPDEVAGELPLAFVVKKPGVNVTEKELVDAVASTVSPQKRLRGGVIFVDAIPKNATGKILRRELRKQIPIFRKSKL